MRVRLFSLGTSDRRTGNSVELSYKRFIFDPRKTFFTRSVVTHWNSLPRAVVVFKRHIGVALRDMD